MLKISDKCGFFLFLFAVAIIQCAAESMARKDTGKQLYASTYDRVDYGLNDETLGNSTKQKKRKVANEPYPEEYSEGHSISLNRTDKTKSHVQGPIDSVVWDATYNTTPKRVRRQIKVSGSLPENLNKESVGEDNTLNKNQPKVNVETKSASGITNQLPTAANSGTHEVYLKTLLLYKQPKDLPIAKYYMMGVGTHYEAVTSIPNMTISGHGKYSSIVVTKATDLSVDEWRQLREYSEKFKVRLTSLFTPIGFFSGLKAHNKTNEYLMFTKEAVDSGIAGVMCSTCSWKFRYKALNATSASIINKEAFRPIMMASDTAVYPATSDAVSVVIYTHEGKSEEMHFLFNANANQIDRSANTGLMMNTYTDDYTALNLALGNLWFEWVTAGLYIGKRRIYVQMHIDDWFSATELYKSSKAHRVGPEAVTLAMNWFKNFSMKLPIGSDMRVEMAFNGAGYSASNYDKGLAEASEKYKAEFHWVSHTWTHQNLDWLEPSDCDGQEDVCRTPTDRMKVEIDFNAQFIKGQPVQSKTYGPYKRSGLLDTTNNVMFKNDNAGLQKHFSPSSLVTPEISGLWPSSATPPENRVPKALPRNKAILDILVAHGINIVTGDNSRKELRNKMNPHHGVYTTNEDYGVTGILIIPRWAVNIFFNTHEPELYTTAYNELNACHWSSGKPCSSKGYEYTFTEAIDRQAEVTTVPWLQFRADPFMFHQLNLNPFTHNGKRYSLVSLWVEKSLEMLFKYIDKLPIQSPKMDAIGNYYRERMNRDFCGIQARVTYDAHKKLQRVTYEPTFYDCTIVLSTTNNAIKEQLKRQPMQAEEYGPELTVEWSAKTGQGGEIVLH